MAISCDLSVIIPIVDRYYDGVASVFGEYKRGLTLTGLSFEIVYVLDGEYPEVLAELRALQQEGEQLTIIQLARRYGESTALNVGFENSHGGLILTLPAYQQTGVEGLATVVAKLKSHDVVVARRYPRRDPLLNQISSAFFNWVLRKVFSISLHDIGCCVRAFKREVISEISVYGDQHRFLPVLAHQRGFRVSEVNIEQALTKHSQKAYRPGIYFERPLEFLTVFFLARFTKRPLRFFGVIGGGVFMLGLILTLFVIGERIFAGVALANRPALLISSLAMILGIQALAIGLIGEIIIFTHAKQIKEYTIAKIIN
ncbi:MAG: glycosyltransferase [Gammaproteobacteria bacterium]